MGWLTYRVMEGPTIEIDARSFAIAAEAVEVIERPALLATFCERFGPDADATLVLLCDALDGVPERILEAAAAVGLHEHELPDLLVLPLPDPAVRDALVPGLHATLGERELDGPLATLPRHGVADGAALQRLGHATIEAAGLRGRLPEGLVLPAGYRSRIPPEYFDDFTRPELDVVHQPDVYACAAYLGRALDCTHVIDVGSGSGDKLLALAPEFKLIGIDYGSNLERCRREHPQHTWLHWDAETEPLPDIPAAVVERSVVICADVIEHLIDPAGLLTALSGLADAAAAILVSTPDRVRVRGAGDRGPPANRAHVREWALDELHELLRSGGLEPAFAGFTINNDRERKKETSLVIVDRARGGPLEPAPDDFRVTAVLSAYNDGDVVEHSVRALVEQGVHVRLVDNWSTDDTVERIQALDLGSALTIERVPPDGPSETNDRELLLRNTERIAREIGEGWVIHQDVDEVRRPPWPGVALRDALHHVQLLGYNAVDHTSLVFVPIDDAFAAGDNMEAVIRHFEFDRRPGHSVQIKAWDAGANPVVDLASSGGHQAVFADRRVFPYKFLQKHYPVRSQAHGRPAEDLLLFDSEFPRDFLLERLTGVGIRRGG
jgi:hypothetical protein